MKERHITTEAARRRPEEASTERVAIWPDNTCMLVSEFPEDDNLGRLAYDYSIVKITFIDETDFDCAVMSL